MAERTHSRTSNPVKRAKEVTETIGAARTITAKDSGKVFQLITSGTDGAAITLPAVAAGLNFTFVVGAAFATTDWTIVSATNVTEGNVIVAGAHVAGVNENTVSFVATAESIGDYVQYISDGTSWFVSGSGVTTGSITFTAP